MCKFGDLDENGGLYKRPGDGDPKPPISKRLAPLLMLTI